MLSFHNDPTIKAKYLARVRAHRLADELVTGKYWENGKGCAVGCTIHGSSHAAYETELGIPRVLAFLEDGIFESLPNEQAMMWPELFLDSIPVGVDLSLVAPRFLHWLLSDSDYGVIRFADDITRPSVQHIIQLYQRFLNGECVSVEEWGSAGSAAESAESAESARSAAWAARSAAESAESARLARSAAELAARSAAESAQSAAWAAESARSARVVQSQKLLELLSSA